MTDMTETRKPTRIPRNTAISLAVLTTTAAAATAQPSSLSHDAWGDLLETYVSEGPDGVNLVDYGALKDDQADRDKLNAYIAQYADLDIESLSRESQFAAWINLYNAVTVRYVVNEYPVNTINPWYSSGPWKKIRVDVGGREISLDGIEHDVLRVQWPDEPRLHYAVNCASYGCPNLRFEPWDAGTLDAVLDDAARAYINHPRGVRIDDDQLDVSSIYKWYREDFGGSEKSVIEHLLKYADEDLARQIRSSRGIDDYNYDWSLNDASG
jgi:hypothetical protein